MKRKPNKRRSKEKLQELGKKLVYIVLGVAAAVMLAGFFAATIGG